VPCVLSYQFNVTEGVLNMVWTQRSVDVMIGLPSDMFSAWLFNQVVAKTVGLEPGVVTMNLGDCHIYAEHFAQVDEYTTSVWASALMNPKFVLLGDLYDFDLTIQDYNPDKVIKFELKV